jgi:hypothetical protein
VANDLGAFIAAEVARAEIDFQNFRARALNVVGVAGGLVTLVGGFLAIAAGGRKDFLPTSGRWSVLIAVLAYVLSTAAALIVNRPVDAEEAKPADLLRYAQEEWSDEGWDQKVAEVSARYLASLRMLNRTAAKWLTAAIGLEIIGIAATALTALLVVQHLP